jgi:hypothetical protein
MAGNSFTNWNVITPRHNAFVQKILQSSCHVLSTIRCKQDYVLSERNGKYVPEKVGLKGVTRDGMDYEMTIVLDLDIKHYAKVSKDRTGLFSDQPQFVITEETGRLISDWCNNGIKVSDIEIQIDACANLDDLRQILIKYPEYKERIKPAVYRRKAQIETLAHAINT